MTLFPVIQRELQMRARQGSTYWSRCAVAAMAALVGVMEMVLAGNSKAPGSAGIVTFSALTWLGFLLACLCALVTADSISSERREGTLGLLLLTDLKSHHVVLGKLTAAGLTASYALFGFVPALGLVALSGGVSGGQVARTALALLNAIFISLVLGAWVSARTQSRHGAMRGALLAIAVLCMAPRILMHVGGALTSNPVIGGLLGSLSPYTAFYLASDKLFATAPVQYWLTLCAGQIEAWLLVFWTAAYMLKNSRAPEFLPVRKEPLIVPLMAEEVEALAAGRTAMLQQDPICWAVSRLRVHNTLLWVGTLLLLLGGTGFSMVSLMVGVRPGAIDVWNSLNLLLSLAAGGLLAWAAGRFLFEGQRNGELELLLSTPLGARDIIGGNWRALSRPLAGAWLLLVFLVLAQFFTSPSPSTAIGGSMPTIDLFGRALLPVNRALDVGALFWMGMWFGLSARKAFSVLAWTVGLVIGLPWLVSYLFIIGASIGSGALWRGGPPLAMLFWFVLWPLLNLAKNIIFIGWAAHKLRSELRTLAPLRIGEWPAGV